MSEWVKVRSRPPLGGRCRPEAGAPRSACPYQWCPPTPLAVGRAGLRPAVPAEAGVPSLRATQKRKRRVNLTMKDWVFSSGYPGARVSRSEL